MFSFLLTLERVRRVNQDKQLERTQVDLKAIYTTGLKQSSMQAYTDLIHFLLYVLRGDGGSGQDGPTHQFRWTACELTQQTSQLLIRLKDKGWDAVFHPNRTCDGRQRQGTVVLSHVCVLSHIWLSVVPWTVARQAPPSMGFPREEYWGGLPFPSPGDLPDPGIEPTSPGSPALVGGFSTTAPPG